ncbi:hypothetical protein EAS64_25905 [Trebonia kvetii]|uniref:Uncharacterized protein n=1 Tax=Trebonia kvetii TaxID=2480626 RepID=A0A6P2BT33_9ACTN|nr:hypothetical protein [Trebonia kvetii]TVZ02259.1 hypothetical protein EAS64_25905 [Trebonia kvetii]
MAASAKRASWSVTGLRASSPNAAAICPRSRPGAVAYPADDRLYFSAARGRRLRGEDDQHAKEVRVALERASVGRRDPG